MNNLGGNMKTIMEKRLPDGTSLIAENWDDPEYPGIRISIKNKDGSDELLCFAEYNTAKRGEGCLCICAYAKNTDEPVYYESYNNPGSPSLNN
jgi:hypothetical protein